MSDSLNSLAALGVGSGGVVGFLIDQLSIASFRGVPFYMLNAEEETGRRVIRMLFPGRDAAIFRDLGPDDGDIHVDGLLIGQDCVRQAEKMRTALRTMGPAPLVHPWFGTFDAILTERGHLRVSEKEFGLVRFEATFKRFIVLPPPKPDFFGRLQDACDAIMAEARGLLQQALGAIAAPLAAIGFASALLGAAQGVWGALGLGAGGTQIQIAVASSLPPLLAGPAAGLTGSDYAGAVADLLAAPALAVAAASQTTAVAAIGSATAPSAAAAGSTAVSGTTSGDPAQDIGLDPATAAAALLRAAASLAAPAGAAPAQATLALAAQMQAVAQAAATGATIAFASTADAAAWGVTIDAALAGLALQASALAAAAPLVCGPAWRAIDATRAAAAADVSSRLLTLPSLLSLTTTRTMSVWRMALILVGDTPELMTSCVVDLWRRNRLGNPAAVPPGTYLALP